MVTGHIVTPYLLPRSPFKNYVRTCSSTLYVGPLHLNYVQNRGMYMYVQDRQ